MRKTFYKKHKKICFKKIKKYSWPGVVFLIFGLLIYLQTPKLWSIWVGLSVAGVVFLILAAYQYTKLRQKYDAQYLEFDIAGSQYTEEELEEDFKNAKVIGRDYMLRVGEKAVYFFDEFFPRLVCYKDIRSFGEKVDYKLYMDYDKGGFVKRKIIIHKIVVTNDFETMQMFCDSEWKRVKVFEEVEKRVSMLSDDRKWSKRRSSDEFEGRMLEKADGTKTDDEYDLRVQDGCEKLNKIFERKHRGECLIKLFMFDVIAAVTFFWGLWLIGVDDGSGSSIAGISFLVITAGLIIAMLKHYWILRKRFDMTYFYDKLRNSPYEPWEIEEDFLKAEVLERGRMIRIGQKALYFFDGSTPIMVCLNDITALKEKNENGFIGLLHIIIITGYQFYELAFISRWKWIKAYKAIAKRCFNAESDIQVNSKKCMRETFCKKHKKICFQKIKKYGWPGVIFLFFGSLLTLDAQRDTAMWLVLSVAGGVFLILAAYRYTILTQNYDEEFLENDILMSGYSEEELEEDFRNAKVMGRGYMVRLGEKAVYFFDKCVPRLVCYEDIRDFYLDKDVHKYKTIDKYWNIYTAVQFIYKITVVKNSETVGLYCDGIWTRKNIIDEIEKKLEVIPNASKAYVPEGVQRGAQLEKILKRKNLVECFVHLWKFDLVGIPIGFVDYVLIRSLVIDKYPELIIPIVLFSSLVLGIYIAKIVVCIRLHHNFTMSEFYMEQRESSYKLWEIEEDFLNAKTVGRIHMVRIGQKALYYFSQQTPHMVCLEDLTEDWFDMITRHKIRKRIRRKIEENWPNIDYWNSGN